MHILAHRQLAQSLDVTEEKRRGSGLGFGAGFACTTARSTYAILLPPGEKIFKSLMLVELFKWSVIAFKAELPSSRRQPLKFNSTFFRLSRRPICFPKSSKSAEELSESAFEPSPRQPSKSRLIFWRLSNSLSLRRIALAEVSW